MRTAAATPAIITVYGNHGQPEDEKDQQHHLPKHS